MWIPLRFVWGYFSRYYVSLNGYCIAKILTVLRKSRQDFVDGCSKRFTAKIKCQGQSALSIFCLLLCIDCVIEYESVVVCV
jgi:hypothetical protein